ncbi:MAG TPA: hypothetical protein V6D20_17270, partial [Candidatus Obscuribacterales bacterium]
AYLVQDCATAVPIFDQVIEINASEKLVGQASRLKDECAVLSQVLSAQADDDATASLMTAQDYITLYGSSVHAAAIRERNVALVSAQTPEALAIPEVCDRFNEFLSSQLIPPSADLVPPVAYSCGQQYGSNGDYERAIDSYLLVQTQYPEHDLAPKAEASLADMMVAQAHASGAGSLPQPGRSGSAPTGSTVVVIQNASPEPMRIAFSGSERKIETLDPCLTCQVYVDEPPATCPELAPEGIYVLDPGVYNVVVTSSNNRAISPFIGQWSLHSGNEYNNCFFTVQRSAGS